MRLAYNHSRKYWEIFPESMDSNEFYFYFIRIDPCSEDDVIAIYDINHWTENDIIDFESLHYEDQESILEKATAIFTTEK